MNIVLEVTEDYGSGQVHKRIVPLVHNSVETAKAEFDSALMSADGLFHVFGQEFISDIIVPDSAKLLEPTQWFSRNVTNKGVPLRNNKLLFDPGSLVRVARPPYYLVSPISGEPRYSNWRAEDGQVGDLRVVWYLPEWTNGRPDLAPDAVGLLPFSPDDQIIVISASCLDPR